MNNFTCPCCGFKTFQNPPGSYDLCAICGWEDDIQQLKSPTMSGGANKKSLKEYQDEVLLKIPLQLTEISGFARDPEWRPLNDMEDSNLDKSPYYWLNNK
jgi:hypothetical protein